MAQFGSDTFGGADGTDLTTYNSAWSKNTAFSANNAVLFSGRVRNNQVAGNPTLHLHSGAPASADYSVSADIYTMSAAGSCSSGVVGRSSTTVETNYHARLRNGIGVQLYKFVGGGASLLGTDSFTVAAATTYNLRLEMIGTSIKVYRDSVLVITATDAGIATAGKAGIKTYDVAAPGDAKYFHVDNYSADDAGGVTNYTITASGGSVAVTGSAATLKFGRVVSASSGAVAITGTAASLKLGRALSALSGSVSVSGIDAALKVGSLISASPGSFIVTGTDATLTKSTSGAYTLNCNSGAFSVSGNAATLAMGRILSASSGVVIVTGTSATLNAAKRILASSGAFSVTGTDATLIYANFNHYTLSGAPGDVAVTGFAASLNFTPEAGDKTGGDDYPLRVVHKARKKTLAEQPNKHLESIIAKAVREVFGEDEKEVLPPTVEPSVGAVLEQKAVDSTPAPVALKTLADAEKDAEKVAELLAQYQQQVQQAQMQEDEDLLVLIMEMY